MTVTWAPVLVVLWLSALTVAVGVLVWMSNEPLPIPMPYTLQSADTRPAVLAQEMPCVDDATRDMLRALMLESMDSAIKAHIERMFEVWMKDDRGQPDRAANGTRQGIKAYLDARKKSLDWTPVLCSG